MEIIAKKISLSPLFVDEFVSPSALLQLYSNLSCHFRNIKVESNDCCHLESFYALGPEKWISKNVHSLVDDRTVKNIVSFFSQILINISLNLCNNSDQTLYSFQYSLQCSDIGLCAA